MPRAKALKRSSPSGRRAPSKARRGNLPERSKIGRPSPIESAKTRHKLLEAIRLGNYYAPACAYAGISYKTFREWILKGEADTKDGVDSIFAEFREQVIQAELEAEARVVALWRSKMPEDWRAAREFLRMRFHKRWKDQGFGALPGQEDGSAGTVYIPIRQVVIHVPAKVAAEKGIEEAIPVEIPARRQLLEGNDGD